MNRPVTIPEEIELFDKGLVIRRAWIMPPGEWEYSVAEVGSLKDIAIKSTRRGAFNAGLKWLKTHKQTMPALPEA